MAEVSPEDVYRSVAALATFLRPDAAGCRIVIDVPDGFGGTTENVIQVPMGLPADPDDMEMAILAALGKYKPGEWVKGKTLATEIGIDDPNNGHFRRTAAKLSTGRDARVESDKRNGYRLRTAGQS